MYDENKLNILCHRACFAKNEPDFKPCHMYRQRICCYLKAYADVRGINLKSKKKDY